MKMFKFIKQVFISTMMFFGGLSNVNPLACVSMNNHKCKVRPEIVNVNSSEPLFYPFSIRTSKSVVVVTILMILMQNCVFLMMLKI